MKKKKRKVILRQMIAPNKHSTAICVKRGGDKNWMMFCGDGFHQWTDRAMCKSQAQQVHDALLGWHSSVLHAGDTIAITDKQADYAAVDALLTKAD